VRSVFEIGADLMALAELMDEAGGDGGELAPEAALELDRWVAELETDQARKLDGYAGLLRHLESQAAVARATAEQFQRKAQARENQVKRLKQRLLDYLEATGQKKATSLSGWDFCVTPNGGQAPLEIDAVPLDGLPREFLTVVTAVNKEAVRRELAGGLTLSWARLGGRGRHLRIRPA
jgi:hypothetical protein